MLGDRPHALTNLREKVNEKQQIRTSRNSQTPKTVRKSEVAKVHTETGFLAYLFVSLSSVTTEDPPEGEPVVVEIVTEDGAARADAEMHAWNDGRHRRPVNYPRMHRQSGIS